MMNKYGFEEDAWETAKNQATAVLHSYAKRRQMIPYCEFVTHIHAIDFDGPHDNRLRYFLGEISVAESNAGRGMLTALVVHKIGDFQPGPGFFELAEELGYNTTNIEKFWIQEVKKVFAANSNK